MAPSTSLLDLLEEILVMVSRELYAALEIEPAHPLVIDCLHVPENESNIVSVMRTCRVFRRNAKPILFEQATFDLMCTEHFQQHLHHPLTYTSRIERLFVNIE